MQCILLAAGKGARLRPLTDTKPKPLVEVGGVTLLDHIVGALPQEVDELIIVIGYFGDMIRAYCKDIFHGRKVTYVEQAELTGTAHALGLVREHLRGRFILMNSDDLHGEDDLTRLVAHERAILAKRSNTPERFGVIKQNTDGTLAQIFEKPEKPPSDLVFTGAMLIDLHIFEFKPTVSIKGEYYVTNMLDEYARKYPVTVVEQDVWIPIGYPEDIEKAEARLRADALVSM